MILEDVTGVGEVKTLQSTSRSLVPRRRAVRAHHLSHNRFIRPQQVTQGRSSDLAGDLLDALAVTGGYDGQQLFVRLQLDLSKQSINSLDQITQKPLELLSEVDFLAKLLPDAGGSESPVSLKADVFPIFYFNIF